MEIIPALLLSYLIGSVSFPGIYARMRSLDLESEGEGHLGASSAYSATGSVPLFVLLAVLDASKGALATYLFGVIGLMGAIVGHIFPVFFRFKGGNGVSVYYGGSFIWVPHVVLVSLTLEALTWRTVRTNVRHVMYMIYRALPLLVCTKLLPAYILLLVKHITFYRSRFRLDSSATSSDSPLTQHKGGTEEER